MTYKAPKSQKESGHVSCNLTNNQPATLCYSQSCVITSAQLPK